MHGILPEGADFEEFLAGAADFLTTITKETVRLPQDAEYAEIVELHGRMRPETDPGCVLGCASYLHVLMERLLIAAMVVEASRSCFATMAR